MNTARSLSKLAVGITVCALLIGSLALPAPAEAQCMVVSTYVYTGPTFITVMKYLNANYSCMYLMGMNVSLCAPPGTDTSRPALTASAMTTYPVPRSCSWNCTGGTACASIVIDGSDGLPVELMDFEIAESRSSDDARDGDEGDPSD